MKVDSRSCTKGTSLSVLSNSREGIGDNRNEQVDQPEVENDDAHNEEQRRDVEFRVHHLIHNWCPL